jgi:DUF1680 family protein
MTTFGRVLPADPRGTAGSPGIASGLVLQPVSLTDYTITDGFWAHLQQLNRDRIIPHCDESMERVGWVENFRAAIRGTLAEDRVGRVFTDSEIYKTMEAMAWEIARKPSGELSDRLTELADLVAGPQAADGYLSTAFGFDGGPERYSDMERGHELYCFGHLLQAAVAVIRAGGPEQFVTAARRLGDHVCEEFGETGRQTIDGHPEIETALVELYRATGERRYLEQARIFIERRGHQTLADTRHKGRDYYQDNVPVREAEVLVGHAVRALYLTAGAIDAAVELGDDELLAATRAQYDRTLQRRTYLHGGMGTNHLGETYGEDFELPSDRAYAETCAAIASVHVAWRLLLATGETRYADVIERALYNNVVSCPSADGRSFFYVNTLHRRVPGIEQEPGVASLRRTDGTRATWFTTSCCPTNLARTLASLGAYMSTVDATGIQVHQYASGTLDATFGSRRRARLAVTTAYPADGRVVVGIEDTDGDEWSLTLRVPAWAEGATLIVGGEERPVEPGAAVVTRVWQVGDEIELHLPVAARFVFADPRIDDVRGSTAVERGPLVYALESVDQPAVDLELTAIDIHAPLLDSDGASSLDGIIPVVARGIVHTLDENDWPYGGTVPATVSREVELTLIPYYRWANRGASTMRVWIPRSDLAGAGATA